MQARSLAVLCAVALSGNVAAAIDPRTPAEAWTAVPFTDQSGANTTLNQAFRCYISPQTMSITLSYFAGGTTSHTAVDGKFLVYHNPW